jgi:hypothetical protein
MCNLLGNIDHVSSNEEIEIQTFVVIGHDVSVQDFLLFFIVELYFLPKTETDPCNMSCAQKEEEIFEIRKHLLQMS